MTSKRSLESDLAATRAECEELEAAMRHSEAKAKNAALDALRLAEEARAQEERGDREEADKRSLEVGIKELQIRLEEAEIQMARGGKKTIEKLESLRVT